MKLGWRHFWYGAIGAPVAILLVTWIGFFNVGASSGHWGITNWFLHFAMRSAVRTHAWNVETPEAIDESLVQPAAGHFAQACAFCHGAPGEPQSPAVSGMLPRPPQLAPTIPSWSNAELYRIVMHGIRFTGMPAWQTQLRPDEVWGMVAFLRRYPDMSPETYRDLSQAQQATDQTATRPEFDRALDRCSACHGRNGLGRSEAVPIIAGQDEAYLLASLEAYARDGRASGIMTTATLAVDKSLWPDLARHFAGLPNGVEDSPPAAEISTTDDGARIAVQGIRALEVPACLSCHGAERRNPVFPKIAGQHRDYIVKQLELFTEGARGGTPYNHLMAKAVNDLAEEQREAVANYFSSLRSTSSDVASGTD